MCDPMTMAIGSFVIGAAQSVMQYMGEMEQFEANERFRKENAERANENAKQEYNANLNRISQEQDASGAQKADVQREARAAVAKATVAAGESGVSGLSVDALLADFYGREGTYVDRLDQQTAWTTEQLAYEQKGVRAKAIDRANSIQPATPPSFLAAGLRIAGAGMDAFGSYGRMTGRYT